MEPVKIGKRMIGAGYPPYFIAEIGANHNGDMKLCKKMIDIAESCGADAVKFQSWSSNSLISKSEYERNTDYADKKRHFGSLKSMVEKYKLTAQQHRDIFDYCSSLNIDFLSSCFSPAEVDLLESLGVIAHKISSMDVTHVKLLEYVAATGKPIILSTGMASLSEIDRAIYVLKQNGSGPIVLLHCVSIYPPEMKDVNLNNIPMLRSAFELPVGFSDHTIGTSIPLASIALGACIIEKHFTIDKDMDGWDHWISADPDELKDIVTEGRAVFEALGSTRRIVSDAELEKQKSFRRSIVLVGDKKQGDILTLADLNYKRPGTGISPDEVNYVLGRKLSKNLEDDHVLEWADMQ